MAFVLDILTTASILFIVTAGLMIIFGVMRIINFAHAALLSVGAYAGYAVTEFHLNPWVGIPVAIFLGCALGMLVEPVIMRPLYNRPLDAILATWGLGIIVTQAIVMIFGRGAQFVQSPLSGTFSVAGTVYSAYRLMLIPMALGIWALLGVIFSGTRFGVKTRAVIMNEDLARSLGIRSAQIRFAAFAIGASLSALAGMLITPFSSVDPNMGMDWLLSAFLLVMVAGSSMTSLLVTCLVFGACQELVSTFVNPIFGSMTIAVLAALVLRIRPEGFSHAR